MELLKYSVAIALRDGNDDPIEINIPINSGFKRVVALPIFSVDDKALFHELNHAISSENIIKNGKKVVKCGLDYDDEEKNIIMRF